MVGMKLKKRIKYEIEYYLFLMVILVFKILPYSFFKVEASFLRTIFRVIGTKYPKIIYKNLKIAFPQRTESELVELKIKIYQFFSEMFVYNLNILAKKNISKVLPEIKINNIDIIKKALNQGNGIMLISAHFGNWELVPYILKNKLNMYIHSIARSMDNPFIEKKVSAFRKYMGSKVIYKKGSLRKILNLLDNNQIVGFLIDQNVIKRESISVNFFNKNITTTPIVSKIHIKKQIPVIPVFLCQEKDHLRLDILEPIEYKRSDNTIKSAKDLTQEYMKIIEDKIKEYPVQWFWFHNRWKNFTVL